MDVHLFREGAIDGEFESGVNQRQRPRLRAMAAEIRRDPAEWIDRAV
jgi:hypothetical protein